MKKWVLAAALSVGLLFLAAATGCAKKAIAKVNGQTIGEDQFYGELTKGPYAKMLLDRLITNALVEQEAKKKNITVSEAEVTTALNEIKAPLGKGWSDMLTQRGLTEEDVKGELKNRLLQAKVFIGDEEMKKFYDANPSMFDRPAQATYRRIVLPNLAQAKQVRSELVGGADFVEAVKKYSIDPFSKPKNGDMPEVYQGTAGDPNLEKFLFSGKTNEISEPIATPYPKDAYQLVQVTKIKPAVKSTYDKCKNEVMQVVLSQKSAEIFSKIGELKANASIDIYRPSFASLKKDYETMKVKTPPPAAPAQPSAPAESKTPAPADK